jgi:pyruvate-formate lyase-activating enzyme
VFHLYLVNPSHYDEDGYVVFWDFPPLPNNTLACLNALALDCARREVLGVGIRIAITVLDESAGPLPLREISEHVRSGRGMVGLTGVQSHQYPRALDIARHLRATGVPVCIGGFHVSGMLALFGEPSVELQAALDLGVSLFCGEAEGGRLDQVLRDAWAGTLRPIYARPAQPPALEGEPWPALPPSVLAKTRGVAPLDVGRGCPFTCSFCTIINVHGRGGRQRRVEDVIASLRTYLQQGMRFFQVTDDNFARVANWREVLTAIAALRKECGRDFGLLIQVDAPSYRKKGFVELCARAGVKFVFIGVESVDPENLRQIHKRQNRTERYGDMFRAWRTAGIHVQAGYILGFAADTPASIAQDSSRLLDDVGFDDVTFFCLTPLPGSADHRDAVSRGDWLDPDLNRYSLHRPVSRHPRMSPSQWRGAYHKAWRTLLDYRRIPGYLRRARADGLDTRLVFSRMLGYRLAIFLHDVHPIEYGQGLRKHRDQRRPELPPEPAWRFRMRMWRDTEAERVYTAYLRWRIGRIYRRTLAAEPPVATQSHTTKAKPCRA